MKTRTKKIIHIILIIMGMILMIGGIVTGKHGASIVGLIVAAVNIQQIIKNK